MKFNLIEKLALLKAIDEVIQMDEEIRKGEIRFLDELAHTLDFDPELMVEARNTDPAEALAVLKAMPDPQKQAMARLLTEAANSDGETDEREMQFIYRVLSAAGVDI